MKQYGHVATTNFNLGNGFSLSHAVMVGLGLPFSDLNENCDCETLVIFLCSFNQGAVQG